LRKLIFAAFAIAIAGCGGDSTGPIASAVGTWNLQSIDGHTLPFTLISQASPPYQLDVVSDVFVAHSNGTYDETATIRENDNGTITTTTVPDNGTWTQNNGAVTVTASDGSVSSAAITGNIITLNADGDVYIYKRQ
jgi:nitrogen fixation protein FixH